MLIFQARSQSVKRRDWNNPDPSPGNLGPDTSQVGSRPWKAVLVCLTRVTIFNYILSSKQCRHIFKIRSQVKKIPNMSVVTFTIVMYDDYLCVYYLYLCILFVCGQTCDYYNYFL
jgi:hypothetical protein